MTFDEFKSNLLKDPKVKEEYDALEFEYTLIEQAIKARVALNMTQKELADKIGTKQSCIARFESGRYNPSVQFLQKVAQGLNKKLTVAFS